MMGMRGNLAVAFDLGNHSRWSGALCLRRPQPAMSFLPLSDHLARVTTAGLRGTLDPQTALINLEAHAFSSQLRPQQHAVLENGRASA